ncbi:prepilin-type N-terminal cleavage/methylation domain-containing protein [Shewanella inventionis]|uniref:MSHA biogenesis protein MshC n=1 Tax=Shewanella inventionis TaxID=1738770 RepID=A0ABQ1JAR1_9GAMM|nr:prepilin-type N-terminal cleavage/methylation domain-containing protein [Shewanella inventionis]MCL1157991.1 prepilin-type N-terminal cleavage/methylation domain-containing protein [Shewanella inventionis]UAL44066.1 prepilin-type N-terminal cleavage/methylation domain-containing protein [Shewanella inventionis]GGB62774.1 MSHA biogenesis protein MshC [Shewanella inventionis]
MSQQRNVQLGFTLVELVTTIIVIAIIAVAVLPRLLSSASFSAYTLRNEFISELRYVQLKAIQNTDQCYQIDVDANGYTLRYFSDRTGNSCANQYRVEPLQAYSADAYISLSSNTSKVFSITFDSLGRMISPACSGHCFNAVADETLAIAVESEGYVYAQ